MRHIVLIHSSVGGHWFVPTFAIKMLLQTLVSTVWTFGFTSLRYIFRSEIARLYGNPLFKLWRLCQTVFWSRCAILQSHQQCRDVPISPHPCQSWLVSIFWVRSILVVWSGISLWAPTHFWGPFWLDHPWVVWPFLNQSLPPVHSVLCWPDLGQELHPRNSFRPGELRKKEGLIPSLKSKSVLG